MFITIGDLIDLFFQIQNNRKVREILHKLFLSDKERTKQWWSNAASIPDKWWYIPQMHQIWNKNITGSENRSYIEYVKSKYFPDNKPVRLLSPGCGTGQKELAIAKLFPGWEITGLDLSEERIKSANKEAFETGIKNITFLTGDVYRQSFDDDFFDIVLFDSSLHHFSGFDTVFKKISASLKSSGIILINEYVGPDRFQWTKEQLFTANRLLKTIPPKYRRRWNSRWKKSRIYRPGILRMILSDPSEACCSSQILSSLHKHFRTIEEINLGGNLMQLILNGIAHNFIDTGLETREILERLIIEDDKFLESNKSDFIFGVYGKNLTDNSTEFTRGL